MLKIKETECNTALCDLFSSLINMKMSSIYYAKNNIYYVKNSYTLSFLSQINAELNSAF